MPTTTFSQSFMCNGNIRPCRCVKFDTSADFKILEAGSNEKAFGIAQIGTKDPPGVSGSNTYAGTTGDEIQVFMAGARTLLEINSAVTAGDYLGSDANGYGITRAIGATDYYVIAQALQTASSGFIEVEVLSGFEMGT